MKGLKHRARCLGQCDILVGCAMQSDSKRYKSQFPLADAVRRESRPHRVVIVKLVRPCQNDRGAFFKYGLRLMRWSHSGRERTSWRKRPDQTLDGAQNKSIADVDHFPRVERFWDNVGRQNCEVVISR